MTWISMPIDRPHQPKKPWFEELTAASCVLTWEQPDFDGGAEIIKYVYCAVIQTFIDLY